jgi:hypothetical protein
MCDVKVNFYHSLTQQVGVTLTVQTRILGGIWFKLDKITDYHDCIFVAFLTVYINNIPTPGLIYADGLLFRATSVQGSEKALNSDILESLAKWTREVKQAVLGDKQALQSINICLHRTRDVIILTPNRMHSTFVESRRFYVMEFWGHGKNNNGNNSFESSLGNTK